MTGRLAATGSQKPVALIVVILTRAAAIAAATSATATTIIATRTTATTAAATEGATRRSGGSRGRRVEIDDTQDLDTFATLADLTSDGRAFGRILQTGVFQRGDMQENIG